MTVPIAALPRGGPKRRLPSRSAPRADALRLDPGRRRPRVRARRPADGARPEQGTFWTLPLGLAFDEAEEASWLLIDDAMNVLDGEGSYGSASRIRQRAFTCGSTAREPTSRRSSTPIRRRPRRSPLPSSRSSSPTWMRRRCSTTWRSCPTGPACRPPIARARSSPPASAQARDAARPPRPARRRAQRAGGGVPGRLHRAHGAPADRRRAVGGAKPIDADEARRARDFLRTDRIMDATFAAWSRPRRRGDDGRAYDRADEGPPRPGSRRPRRHLGDGPVRDDDDHGGRRLGRYVLNKPLTGGFELTEMMLAALIFCGLPLVSQRREHIVIDTFDPLMSKRGQARPRRRRRHRLQPHARRHRLPDLPPRRARRRVRRHDQRAEAAAGAGRLPDGHDDRDRRG